MPAQNRAPAVLDAGIFGVLLRRWTEQAFSPQVQFSRWALLSTVIRTMVKPVQLSAQKSASYKCGNHS